MQEYLRRPNTVFVLINVLLLGFYLVDIEMYLYNFNNATNVNKERGREREM